MKCPARGGCHSTPAAVQPPFPRDTRAGRGTRNRAVFAGRRFNLFLLLFALLGGCATPDPAAGPRPFDFQRDTFAFANQLVWEYHFNARGKWVHQRRKPEPDYTHHCFVIARTAKQFFQNATFDPVRPVVDEAAYRQLIRKVISVDPDEALPDAGKIVIPGYADLRAFSAAREDLLKAECGGAWHSYFQRGHWRMIFPFTRSHQERMAAQLAGELKRNHPPVVHVVRFPQLTINHAVLLFDATETEKEIRFAVYDPNQPGQPTTLTFDRALRRFRLPQNDYFIGGRVDVYEIYRNWRY